VSETGNDSSVRPPRAGRTRRAAVRAGIAAVAAGAAAFGAGRALAPRIVDRPLPNFGERRPAGAKVKFVVLHYTQTETLAQALGILRDPESEVSSHYVVDRDGTVYRLVPEDKRAWHAGVGSWRGEDDVNSVSVGVEIVNAGPPDPFPDKQMRAVVALCRDIASRHPGVEFIGHSDSAPGRKVDPGPLFPWSRLAEAGLPNPHAGGDRRF
jgi:N-acetylmuramoyl-L-alanine amidase